MPNGTKQSEALGLIAPCLASPDKFKAVKRNSEVWIVPK
jgi:hypothetical protein